MDGLKLFSKSILTSEALPSTRALGLRFRCANTTVFRALTRLAAEGHLWQHPVNGRFYPAAARATLDRPKPVACLIRRLELCSALYRECLEGISAGCGRNRRTMLLWHDELLVNHPDPSCAPQFADIEAQRAILKGFIDHHGGFSGGYILDHVWSDAALRSTTRKLHPAVLLYRRAPADLPICSVHADFAAAAMQALAHLFGRGFESIIPVQPFEGDPAVEEFLAELEKTAAKLGCGDRLGPRIRADSQEIVSRLSGDRRTGLIVPEDHTAVRLSAELSAGGWDVPGRVGVLAVMGTDVVAARGLSRIRFDYRAMGDLAIDLLASGTRRDITIGCALEQGTTT